MTHTSPDHAPRILVDSGTDADQIRAYYELSATLTDRLRSIVAAEDTIADAISQVLDERLFLQADFDDMTNQRDAAITDREHLAADLEQLTADLEKARAERDEALAAATEPAGDPA